MRAIAKKEREVAKKLEAVRIETEARIAKEAAIRDAERKKKVEEKLKKSQAILKEIERKGEESRLRAVEKEKRIQAILEVRSRVFFEFGAVRTVSSEYEAAPRRYLYNAGQEGQEEGGDPYSKREGREKNSGRFGGEQREAAPEARGLRRQAGRGALAASLVSIARCRGWSLLRV